MTVLACIVDLGSSSNQYTYGLVYPSNKADAFPMIEETGRCCGQ